ncbi:10408_t:CDS:10 [Diversispora eburnea]|uniref:Ubiquitin carboxyl-terminal hydrolase 14 n=1 Tax=Diversispora eburnea TaxID=1213867 RepID=A0A9N8YMI4_9GLOM|nr:10408_t:CDS:10 [Diversispora eburnea]
MAVCPHVSSIKIPSATTLVYKEECTLCFDSQNLAPGIEVCLTCFNAGCNSPERQHARTHYGQTNHPLVLIILRLIKDKPKRVDENEEPPQKISKLAIVPEDEEKKYEYVTYVKCYSCGGIEVEKTIGELPLVIDAVMNSVSAARKSEIKAWEEEITECEHARNLIQDSPKELESKALAHCNNCELKENLWICLVCGNLGCGRQQFGGVGGNGHGLAHFENTSHPISCKLGTITPEGSADIYCYLCNDSKLDPFLENHLSNFGINVKSQQKTEKNMTELQIEENLKYDFSMVTEDGKELEPLFGPGYTGIKNLGNSCYMGSVLQSVFSLDSFQKRYYPTSLEHQISCLDPANCIQCQLYKIADGLLSGRYSQPIQPVDEEKTNRGQEGIAPNMFKALIGKDHSEFSTMRQQDAFEFLQHLITTIERKEHNNPEKDPTRAFKFTAKQRLQCLECKRVRYQTTTESHISIPVPTKTIQTDSGEEIYEPVTFEQCLESFAGDAIIEYSCPACKRKTNAATNTRFVTFPEVLVVHTRRFDFENWVSRKISVPIIFSQDLINLDKYIAPEQPENEELLPDEPSSSGESISVDEMDLNQLLLMGFPENRCKKALITTGNIGSEVAMNWLFEHMDDPDIDSPIVTGGSTSTNQQVPSESDIVQLTEMGFQVAQVKKALAETNNNVERAVEWLFSHPEDFTESFSEQENINNTFGDSSFPANYQLQSIISHKGTSVHCGHYVAHVFKDQKWVLFNDDKVVNSQPPLEEAYVYILKRIPA